MRGYAPLIWAFGLSALGYLCLVKPTAFWTGLTWTIAAGFMLSAILQAVFRRGRERSFWVGFLVFGWAYMILSFNHWPLEFIEGHLLTTRIFDEIYLAVHPAPAPGQARAAIDTWDLLKHKPMQQDWNLYHGFNQIQLRWAWHGLAALAVGLAGGFAALCLVAPRPEPSEEGDAARGPRFSVGELMAVIVVLSAGFAALRTPNGLTLNLVFTIFAAALAWATLAAILGSGRRKAFWAGFAVFAWPYLFAAYSQFDVRLLTYGWNPAAGYLPTSRLWGELYPIFHREPSDPRQMIDAWNPGYHNPTKLAADVLYDLNREYFVQIGHAIAGLFVGSVGGLIALRICASNDAAARVASE